MKVSITVLLCAVVAIAFACNGKVNDNPIFTGEPTFVSSTTNGKLYRAGDGDFQFHLVHVYGTAYEMGLAQGQLLKDDLQKAIPLIYEYMESQIDEYLHTLPEDLRHLIEKYGIQAALDATYMMTKQYTPSRFYEEIQGIADGSGVPYNQIRGMAMLPELIKAACSMFGAWGEATASLNGTLVQLRALDWNADGPFQEFAAVVVYHPKEGDGHAFATVGFTGLVGTFTGLSVAPVGICEKVWLGYNGTSTRFGAPWTFVLRDILQYDMDIDSAISRMADARRTCSIFVGVGDGQTQQFRGIEYSHETLNVYNDRNYPVVGAHAIIPGVMYWDKHVQPSNDACLPDLLQQYHGQLDAANTIKYITSQAQTGNLHIAIYDFASLYMYVAYASPGDGHGHNVVNAYDRPFTRLDMAKLFALPL